MKIRLFVVALAVTSMFIWKSSANAAIIFQDDFESYTTAITGWNASSAISLQLTGGINNSKCAKVAYTGSGTSPYWFSKDIGTSNLSDIYVRFYFKVDDPSGGSKFLKLFGKQNAPTGYANTTFALNYYSNTLFEISYGAGTGTVNDTQDVIRYSGDTVTDSNVILVKKTAPFDPKDGQWHCFEAHMKYNDNGQRNGIYQVWIDGVLRIHASNVVNRNNLNSMFFQSVDLANYSHSNQTHNWNLWYDNVIISTSYIGTLGTLTPVNLHPPQYYK